MARVAVIDCVSGARLAAAEAVAERHSSNLLRLCVETTEKAGVSVAGLAGIACGAGPGSFTGLRVGLAVAKGLAMPADLPLLLVSSLEALATDMRGQVAAGEWLLPCLDAGKGQLFAALFAKLEGGGVELVGPTTGAFAFAPETVAGALTADGQTVVFSGPGAQRYLSVLMTGFGGRGRFVEVAGPTADAVAALALPRLARGERDDLGRAVPLYGRGPDITQPKRAPR